MLDVGVSITGQSVRGAGGEAGFYPTTIDQSLRFNDNDSAYLSWTPASAGNRKTWTWSGWVKRGNISSSASFRIFGASNGSSEDTQLYIVYDMLQLELYNSGTNYYIRTDAVLRDPSAWYHVVAVWDTPNATSTDRMKLYVNGERITAFDVANYPTQNYDGFVNQVREHRIGSRPSTVEYFDGYLAEVHFTDGTAYTADDFGEFKNGVWVAKTPSVTYGTNGFYQTYSNGASLGEDFSGNGNTFTATNLAATDQMLDSPTNNFATLNPLATRNRQAALAEGNLYSSLTAPSADNCYSNFKLPTSGKWYWETHHLRTGHGLAIGITKDEYAGNLSVPSTAYTYYNADGTKWNNNSGTAYGSSFFATSTWYTVGVYYDADAGTVGFTLDGVDQGTAFSSLDTSEGYYACASNESGSGTINVYWNFGQDSSFAGTKTPQGNTDANGIGDFYYAPPTGYLALCTANLPEPSISPLNDVTPSDYFNTVVYTGNSGTQSIDTGFAADFVWIKGRNVAYDHYLYDVQRGANQALFSRLTNAETTVANSLTSFDANGFSLGADAGVNGAFNYVAWNWKANGTGVTNTDGTITSTVSANVDSGFSIVSYTGDGTGSTSSVQVSGPTVGHGLNTAPEMIILKNRDSTYNWYVQHSATGPTYPLFLNLTDAATYDIASVWNGTAPTSSVFSIGGFAGVNGSGQDYIAYCFHSVEGHSKVGSYVGNGSSTDGPFVFTGFSPSWILCKRTDATASWVIMDTARDTYNIMQNNLLADSSNADAPFAWLDALSNGFKVRTNNSAYNASGGTYIYIAFSSNPFKFSTAR